MMPLAHSSPTADNQILLQTTRPATPEAQTSQTGVAIPQPESPCCSIHDPQETSSEHVKEPEAAATELAPKFLFQQDEDGNWFNGEICASSEEEEEVYEHGNAEPSEDEVSKETKDN